MDFPLAANFAECPILKWSPCKSLEFFQVSVVTWGYMATVLLFNLHLLKISLIPLWQALLYVCLTGENLWRIWCLCDLAQKFLNTRDLALRYIHRIYIVMDFHFNEGKLINLDKIKVKLNKIIYITLAKQSL